MTLIEPPRLAGVLHRVPDPDEVAAFYADLLGCVVAPSRDNDWIRVDLGANQALFLAGDGPPLVELDDRWDRQGIIPIMRTFHIAELERRLAARRARWVTPPFEYFMRGTGRLGYVSDPARQPFGIQERFADSDREEDLVAAARSGRRGSSLSAGLAWLIFQADDIDAVRDFYSSALHWVQRRGTSGFGWMLRIADDTTLQIAFRGVRQEPQRSLANEPALGVLAGDPDDIAAAFTKNGGSVGTAVDGKQAVIDPEGHAWLITSAR